MFVIRDLVGEGMRVKQEKFQREQDVDFNEVQFTRNI